MEHKVDQSIVSDFIVVWAGTVFDLFQCSDLGKTPCDSCIARGRPDDCTWDIPPSKHRSSPGHPAANEDVRFASQSDLSDLRSEVQRLSSVVDRLVQRMPGSLPKIQDGPAISPVETAVTGLEQLVTARQLETQTKLLQPSQSVRVQASTDSFSLIPDALHPERRVKHVVLSVIGILPSPETGMALVELYFDGPLHAGWPVSQSGSSPYCHILICGSAHRSCLPIPLSPRRGAISSNWHGPTQPP